MPQGSCKHGLLVGCNGATLPVLPLSLAFAAHFQDHDNKATYVLLYQLCMVRAVIRAVMMAVPETNKTSKNGSETVGVVTRVAVGVATLPLSNETTRGMYCNS
mmetsp:Transcript_105882/g.192632  ORF Transcript_105882/g.192632 Transcript_105882/m.192632 type:complete len:103 (+) Transcript_105882:102-410(+)